MGVAAAYRLGLPDDCARCKSYLTEGDRLDVDTFLEWFDSVKKASIVQIHQRPPSMRLPAALDLCFC